MRKKHGNIRRKKKSNNDGNLEEENVPPWASGKASQINDI